MLVRKSAKGRIYYGCSNYPKCNFMTWDEPVPEKMPPSAARPCLRKKASSTAPKRAAALRSLSKRSEKWRNNAETITEVTMQINVIGAGLAGCEATLWLADAGVQVDLYEQKPGKFSPAHKSAGFAELICSIR